MAVEIDNRGADHGVALEGVAAQIGLAEFFSQRLVRIGRMAAEFPRLFVQGIEPLVRNLPPATLFLERGGFGGGSLGVEGEGFAFSLHANGSHLLAIAQNLWPEVVAPSEPLRFQRSHQELLRSQNRQDIDPLYP